MNERIKSLRDHLYVEQYPLCTEKGRLATFSFQKTEGEPQILRRAKAFAHILQNITIFIEDGELIVGNGASKPMGLEVEYYFATWSQDEIDALKEEGYAISEDDEAEIRRANEYWKGRTVVNRAGSLFDDERMWPFMQSGLLLPAWKSRGEGSGGGYAASGMGLGLGNGLYALDYEKVLNKGLNTVIEEAELELKDTKIMSADAVRKVDFLKAAIISNRAVIALAERFSVLASIMAAEQIDPTRKRELESIAETCRRVPALPARSFYEAIQSFWFIFLVINPTTTAAAGRFDQYMYPFYKRDKDAGSATDEGVLELLECLRIKDMQLNRTSGRVNRQKNAGMAKWHNWTIGGQTSEGKDATNELSYLILEAARDCQTTHHTVTVRVHDATPDAFMLKALDVVRTGIGMPAFVGDESYIGYLQGQGLSLEKARDYLIAGCLDAQISASSRTASYFMFIVPPVLEITLNNGVWPRTGKQLGLRTGEFEDFRSFEDLMEAFKEQLRYFMGLVAEYNNVFLQSVSELQPDAFASSLMVDAIKEGKASLNRTMPFENGAVLNAVGMINVADSLAAIKKLLFEEKKFTKKDLKTALAADWQGNGYEEMRKAFLAVPKFGNDDDTVDLIAKDLYQFWAETAGTFNTVLGGTHKPSAISISAQWPGGAITGATPDGRLAGDCLADGTMSPMRGMDAHGPTAVMKSAAKINQTPYQATLLNMKFHPSALKTEEDRVKLSSLVRTYLSHGGKHVQFNVVGKQALLEAQTQPETNRQLIVRVAGYSAYFVQLGKVIQDDIIGRTEHEWT